MPSRRAKILGWSVFGAIVLLAPLAGKVRIAHAAANQGEQSANAAAAASTGKDRTDLSVTVYNSNLALVRDVRQVRIERGEFPLKFEDVAAAIMPQTVHFRSLTDPSKLSVVEQNYEYDLLDPQKLLQKYVGREVTLVQRETDSGSTKWVETKAQLLSDNGSPVWKIGDEIVTGMAAESYRFPDLPANLYSQPTLIWTLDNRGAETQSVEASYLTNSMNWSADYVLNVTRDEKTADLDGWVTLVNNSGAAYENAKLQLVAGEVHRTAQGLVEARDMAMNAMSAPAKAAQFQQEGFSEYHLYTLQRRTSIQNNESKQISLLTGTNIPVEKYLEVEGQPYYYRNPQGIGNAIPQPVKVFYRFKNDAKSGLGMPLPAGTVRVYQADSQGGTQFAGEDTISHTPKDETLRIYVGDAFDVVCERKQMDFKRIAPDLFEMEYQITLRNHKDGPVTIEVREPVGGDWDVLNSNYKWTKLDASTIGFEIPVDKDGTATLDYRVRVKW
ncbi:MAG TPA: DUF4139 domain-containing protein [Candidatus Acidoferrales bacterium]|jgi:hypothetical protein|nr:DUF4139 domain-containing protein [Candidatus Acidoferrales bacterium]